jgi:hypothetical protein
LPALGVSCFRTGPAGFLRAYHCGVSGKVCAWCVRGRGEQECRPAAPLGRPRQRLHANSVDAEQAWFLWPDAFVFGCALQTTKVAIGRSVYLVFECSFAAYASRGQQKPPCFCPCNLTARPRTIFRMPPEALVVTCNLKWPRFSTDRLASVLQTASPNIRRDFCPFFIARTGIKESVNPPLRFDVHVESIRASQLRRKATGLQQSRVSSLGRPRS